MDKTEKTVYKVVWKGPNGLHEERAVGEEELESIREHVKNNHYGAVLVEEVE